MWTQRLLSFWSLVSCQKPSVTSSYFVADDATFHFSSVFVVEFLLKCENELKVSWL